MPQRPPPPGRPYQKTHGFSRVRAGALSSAISKVRSPRLSRKPRPVAVLRHDDQEFSGASQSAGDDPGIVADGTM
jgi:hypothetical protein